MFDFKSLLNDIFMRKKRFSKSVYSQREFKDGENDTVIHNINKVILLLSHHTLPLRPKEEYHVDFSAYFFPTEFAHAHRHTPECVVLSHLKFDGFCVFRYAVRVYLIHNLLSGSFKINQDLRKCIRRFFPREFFAGI